MGPNIGPRLLCQLTLVSLCCTQQTVHSSFASHDTMLYAGRARSFGGNSLLYPAILAASTLIRLFSEMLKF
jgi:hypothetical protein